MRYKKADRIKKVTENFKLGVDIKTGYWKIERFVLVKIYKDGEWKAGHKRS